MITVAGEALIDLIVDQAGHVDPRMGGGPFNVARAVARLGQPATFLGRLSGDRFGQLMRADLDRNGVRVAVAAPSAEPTTLALVDVDPAGVPAYHFYLAGTSAAAIGPAEAVLPDGATALHVGTLGLVMEPVGTSIERLATGAPDGVIAHARPELPPGAIGSRQAYLDRLGRITAPRADVVKASTEDLAYLFPGQDAGGPPPACSARDRPACWSPTAPPRCARSPAAKQIQADVPAAPVVDTVGAGDSFGGAFLAWWIGNGHGRAACGDPEPVREAHPGGHLRLGGDLHAPRRRTSVGLRTGRSRRLALAAPGLIWPRDHPDAGEWPAHPFGWPSRMPRMNAAWPTCCAQSSITLTSRTPSVTGGFQRSSTTRPRSGSVTPATSRIVWACTAS